MGGGRRPPEPPGIFRAWKERHQGGDKNGEAMMSDLPADASRVVPFRLSLGRLCPRRACLRFIGEEGERLRLHRGSRGAFPVSVSGAAYRGSGTGNARNGGIISYARSA